MLKKIKDFVQKTPHFATFMKEYRLKPYLRFNFKIYQGNWVRKLSQNMDRHWKNVCSFDSYLRQYIYRNPEFYLFLKTWVTYKITIR